MDFHAFMYVTIGRRHELERGMAGKDPVLYQRMLDEIAEYAPTPIVMASEMDFCELLWRRYREVAEAHGRQVRRGEEAAWGGYLVLADTTSEAQAWAEDCLRREAP
jgi:hypothetical protein